MLQAAISDFGELKENVADLLNGLWTLSDVDWTWSLKVSLLDSFKPSYLWNAASLKNQLMGTELDGSCLKNLSS